LDVGSLSAMRRSISARLGKAALDERVLAAMRKVPRAPLRALLPGPSLRFEGLKVR
jgi:hypothetical protein